MALTSSTVVSATLDRASAEKVRTVASKWAVSGMMLRWVPAWRSPTVTTTGSNTSNRRVTMVCRAVTISQAAGMGSLARCGAEPWPPAPWTVTFSESEAARIGPGREPNSPCGMADATCRA